MTGKRRFVMKRIISAVLSAVIALSTVAFADGGETVAAKYAEDIALLKKLEVISYIDNIDDENTAVTRAEFTSAIVELAYGKDFSGSANTGFSDVPSDSPYASAIAFAKDMGLVNGVSATEFAPESVITAGQAFKILVLAMGYSKFADDMGGYPQGYYAVADKLDILDGVVISSDTVLTAGVLSRIILNAGFSELAKTEYTVNGINYSTGSGETFFETAHNIYIGEGVIYSNEYTELGGGAESGGSIVKIGDFTGKSYSDIKTEEYMGYYVEFYYRADDVENIVLYIKEKEHKNEVTVIDADDVISFKDGVLKYYRTSSSSSTKSENVPLNTSVIYNGVLIDEYDETDFVGKTGEIKLIENNGDKTIDVINIVAYENFIVSAINSQDYLMYDLITPANTLDFSDEDFANGFVVWDEEGKRVKINNLAANDVLTMAKSKDGKYVRALLSKTKLSGTVTGMVREQEEPKVSIDGVEYRLEKRFYEADGAKIGIGTKVEAYMDVLGRVAYLKLDGANANFAVVISCVDEADHNMRGAIKMMDATGKIGTYLLAQKVTVDGTRAQSVRTVPQNVKNSEVIRYKLNDDNEINWIDTPVVTNESGGSVYKLADINNKKYIVNSNSFSGVLQLSNSMVIMNVPKNKANASTKDYSIGSSSDFANGERYTGTGYAVEENAMLADVVVIQDGKTGSLEYSSPAAVIRRIGTGVNADDEPVDELELVTVSSKSMKVQVSREDNVFANSGAKVGDVIKYETDASGEVVAMEVIFDGETRLLNHNEAAGRGTPLTSMGGYFDSIGLAYYGNVYNRSGNYVQINIDEQILNYPTSNIKEQKMYFDLSGCKSNIITVDLSGRTGDDKVKVGDINTLADEIHFGTGSDVFFYTTYGQPKMMVIYK